MYRMEYLEQVSHVFAESGLLVKHNPQYQIRAGQQTMAHAVARTIDDGGVLVVEAGTGTGKTFAYLVPALLSGKRVLVSTATKALQDQLFHRDIPNLLTSLELPASVALLKGRSSYLCTHRMELARHEALSKLQLKVLAKVEKWAQATDSGDLDELTDGNTLHVIRHWVSSTRDNCLGQDCPDFKTCHVNQARKKALAADVVVVNHHLFFADQSVRASGMAELLPTVDVCIFDEAHQINETGIQFLGEHLSSRQIVDFARDVLVAGLQHARGQHDWQGTCNQLERAMQDLRLVASSKSYEQRLRWHDAAPEGVAEAAWAQAIDHLDDALQAAYTALEQAEEVSPDFKRLKERCELFIDALYTFTQPLHRTPQGDTKENTQDKMPSNNTDRNALDWVRWVETGKHLRLVQAPLDIGRHMRRVLGYRAGADESADAEAGNYRKSWIFTSATLGYAGDVRWFTQPCGLYQSSASEIENTDEHNEQEQDNHADTEATTEAQLQWRMPNIETLEVVSPFNYPEQAKIYVPPTFPQPNTAEHSEAVALMAEASARRIGGRTLVLTTTTRAMHDVAEALRTSLEDDEALNVLVQGEQSKHMLLETFASGTPEKGYILVATASFWEGIDIPGSALELVLIDKLPFPPPHDPMVEARCRRIEESGGSPFAHYSLPEAAVALKQGAGRLIRTESDRGILVLCDVRLLQKGYGKRLLAGLPPMEWLSNKHAFAQSLNALNAYREAACEADA